MEILSPSTADYDYGQKFVLYGICHRKDWVDRWALSTYRGLDAIED